jgi:hypothetical protein
MSKSNGVHGPVASALMAGYSGTLGGLHREEHDTLPEITIDLEETQRFVRPVQRGLFARFRAWLATRVARLAWRLMP